jgi:hypothetical protein
MRIIKKRLRPLYEVLQRGNTTGANDISVDVGQKIDFQGGNEILQDGTGQFIEVNASKALNVNIGDSVANTSGSGFYVEDSVTGERVEISTLLNLLLTQTDASGFFAKLETQARTADRTYTFKDASGTIAFTSDIPALQNLASVLSEGTSSGANDIVMDAGQKVQLGAATEYISNFANYLAMYGLSGVLAYCGDKYTLLNTSGYFSVGDQLDSNQEISFKPSLSYIEVKNSSNGFNNTLAFTSNTDARTFDFPDADGTIALLSDIPTSSLPTRVNKAFADTGYTAANNEVVVVDPSGGTTTINLPAGSANDVIVIKQKAGTTNSVIIDANGAETIEDPADGSFDATVTIGAGQSLTLSFDGTDKWDII